MEVISHYEVGAGGASSITFSDIPQEGYTDLYLVTSLRTSKNDSVDTGLIRFNGSSSNFTNRSLIGAQTSVFSADYTTSRQINSVDAATSTSNTFSSHAIYIPNYTSSNYKSFSAEGATETNSGYNELGIMANLWSVTDPITSITIDSSTDFVQYSSATLYGVKSTAGTGTPKATGGAISYVDGYWVHKFTASGTFTPTENLSNVEYLVVAGGGGGGKGLDYPVNNSTGGGGAGGYRSSVTGESSGGGASAESKLSLTSGTGYTVTVGAGGSGGALLSSGSNGSDSVFGSITSIGGGGGAPGESGTHNGSSGGSGGGSAGSGGTGGAGTTNQGYAGYTSSGGFDGAGGGGAAEVGNTDGLRQGGDGLASSITGTSTYYAGGGGSGTYANTGGAGGLGGGGVGSTDSGNAGAGTANTGGGGGGLGCSAGGSSGAAGAGGSGIVIVRYAA
jgi:hypothetical protein